MKISLFILLSLQSYYFYEVGVALFPLVSFLIIVLLLTIRCREDILKIQTKATVHTLLFYFLLFLWSLLGLIYLNEVFNLKRLVGFTLVIIATLYAEKFFKNISTFKLIKTYLTIHLCFFYIQIILYYSTGIFLDYITHITGETQRVLSVSFDHPVFGHLIRPSGLFIEPGTYATFIAPFVALFSKWRGRTRKSSFIFWCGLISLFISSSVFGILFGLIILISLKSISLKFKIISLTPLVAYIAPYMYYRFIHKIQFGGDNGIGIREGRFINAVEYIFTNANGFLFGIKNLLSLNPHTPYIMSDNDVGLLFYLTTSIGVFPSIFLVFLLFIMLKRVGYEAKISLLLVLLSKHSIFTLFFPFMIVLILSNHRRPHEMPVYKKPMNVYGSSTEFNQPKLKST
jgi:hypothetical protein